ncbi:MAG: hypothetical protein KDD89_04485, partial [Anaerolineales bacterium]|nr:hypothetical protein [Anaerolineales bacterium]
QLATLHALNAAQSDDQLDITLWWQVNRATNTNYVAFVQLLGEDGRVITQSDQIPAAYTRPTTSWLPGEFITDLHTLNLPPDLPAGEYRLLVGLYEPVSGERLGVVETVFSAER